MFNHLSCINFSLQCFVSLQSNTLCFTSSLVNIPYYSLLATTLFHFFLLSNNILCTTSYPRQSSIFSTVLMIFFPEILLIYFVSQYHYISLSFNRNISLKLHSYCFLHTNANLIICSSSFSSIVQLFTPILHFCYSEHCFIGSSVSKHMTIYQYFKICPNTCLSHSPC